jgi:hypothetical protein
VDPVPDPLLFFPASAGNRTRASRSVAKNFDFSSNMVEVVGCRRTQWVKYVARVRKTEICEGPEWNGLFGSYRIMQDDIKGDLKGTGHENVD